MNSDDIQPLIRELKQEADTRILLLVADGLGGLPGEDGLTELESARTPHLDELAREGVSGLHHPVAPGITCGSGPGHLALFGYDPLTHRVGRGVLSSLGIDFDLQIGDVAARGNFCTIGEDGTIEDRRAGRISDSEGSRLVEKLREIELEDVEVFVEHVKEYRFAVILRGEGLGDKIRDTDPHITGVAPRKPEAEEEKSNRTARLFENFIEKATDILGEDSDANMVLLRGFSSKPDISPIADVYGLDACALPIYPMYRGLSRLLGMNVPDKPTDLDEQAKEAESRWEEHNFFFVHHKKSDSSGEDGDPDRKVGEIEALDARIPRLRELEPDVFLVTGDHSTPSRLRSHSWHPVPVLLHASTCRPDRVETFGERAAIGGGLGQFEAKFLMPLAMAHARRLEKFGA